MPAESLLWPPATCLQLVRRPLKAGRVWQHTLWFPRTVTLTCGIWPMLLFRAAMRITKFILYSWTPTPAASYEPHWPQSWRHRSNSPTKGHPVQGKMQQLEEKKGQRGWVEFNGRHSGNGPGLNSYRPYTFACVRHWCPSSVIQARCRQNAPTTHPYSAN